MTCLRGAVLGLPLAAAALWIASVTTTGAPPAPADRGPSAAEQAAPAPWFDLERQRARLQQLTTTPQAEPERNPFRFGASPARSARPPVRRSAPGDAFLADRPAAPLEVVAPLRLVGIAAAGPADGPTRSAILSGLDQLFIAGPGDLVAERYRVTAVSDDVVELRDETTGRLVRLALR